MSKNYQVGGFSECVMIVRDLDTTSEFYQQVAGWIVVNEQSDESALRNLWQLPATTGIKQTLLGPQDADTGFVRLVELNGVEQEHIRANSQIWDTGGIYDVNTRVRGLETLARQLHDYGWFGVNEPVPMKFGEFEVMEWLAKNPDGITLALIERLKPKLENDTQQSVFSSVFNSSMIVADHRAELDFYQQLFGFSLTIHQQQTFEQAKSNVFGMPNNLVNKVPHVLSLLGPEGERQGTVEVVSFPEFEGNDYAYRAKPPHLGIVTLRFPVTDVDALYQNAGSLGYEVNEPVQMTLAPYGQVKILSVITPAGTWLECYQTL